MIDQATRERYAAIERKLLESRSPERSRWRRTPEGLEVDEGLKVHREVTDTAIWGDYVLGGFVHFEISTDPQEGM